MPEHAPAVSANAPGSTTNYPWTSHEINSDAQQSVSAPDHRLLRPLQHAGEKLVEKGVSVTAFTPRVDKNAPEHEVLDGVEVFRLPCLKLPKLPIAVNFPWLSFSMLPSNITRMRDIMQERGVELMHVHNHMFDMALNGVILKKMLNIPLVLSIHSIIFHPNPVFNAILGSVDATFLRWCMVQRATHLVDLDMVTARYRKRRFGVDKGTLIPLASDFPAPPNPADVDMLRKNTDSKAKRSCCP